MTIQEQKNDGTRIKCNFTVTLNYSNHVLKRDKAVNTLSLVGSNVESGTN